VTLKDFESSFCVKFYFASVVGELKLKRTAAALRGFLAAAQLSCFILCVRLVQQNV